MAAFADIDKIKKLMSKLDQAKLRKFFYSRKQTEYLIRWIFKNVMKNRSSYLEGQNYNPNVMTFK